MDRGLLSTRYATALLEFSIENDQQEEVYAGMKTLSTVYLQVPKLQSILTDSSIPLEDKKRLLNTAIGAVMPYSLEKMTDLIFKHEREELIHYIALRYIDLYRERNRIINGKLITAVSLDKENENKILSRIKEIVKEKLEVEMSVDPDLIGGFLLYLDGYRWDASISGELTRIKGKLKKLEAR